MSLPRAIRPEAAYFRMLCAAGTVTTPPAVPPTEPLHCTVVRKGKLYLAKSNRLSVNRVSALGPTAAAKLLGRLWFFRTAVGVPEDQMKRLEVEVLAAEPTGWAMRVTLKP